uniref:hypothetical protein n=1 Tax=Microbulbifer agarilyticus TaxID=260552 RepID=UPI00138A52F4|nr:hypothetical protein [Microbulbifer agarilyticus]
MEPAENVERASFVTVNQSSVSGARLNPELFGHFVTGWFISFVTALMPKMNYGFSFKIVLFLTSENGYCGFSRSAVQKTDSCTIGETPGWSEYVFTNARVFSCFFRRLAVDQ